MNLRLREVIGSFTILLPVLLLAFYGCNNEQNSTSRHVLMPDVTRAVAVLHAIQGHQVKGVIRFQQEGDGVKIIAHLEGLKPGKHGFHIHEYGDCRAPDGASAGGHFNPEGKKHGGSEASERHLGDLGNIVADISGVARLEHVDKHISLKGKNSILGRGVVVHAVADDFVSQPSGAAGERIACGVIGVAE